MAKIIIVQMKGANMAKLKITVIYQEGHCAFGHKKGDFFFYDGHLPDICPPAWDVLFSYVRVLQKGGEFEWAKRPGTCEVACPDGKNPVHFLIERID